MNSQRCKGTKDLSPAEMTRFRVIEGTFRESALRWGYREVKTPTLEYLHLFTSAGTLTPSMLNRVYSFLDWDGWSGERVVLRPDSTIPIARLYIESMAGQKLARLYYVTNTFIFEETGTKSRERWQCGAELIGVGSPEADTELISLPLDVLKKLRFADVQIRLSHAGLIKSLLASLGLSTQEQSDIFDQILDGNADALARVKSGKPGLENILLPLLSLKGQSAGFLKNLKALAADSVPESQPYFDDFIAIVEMLEKLGTKFQIDVASGAGFEYYTGIIFQFFIGEEKVGGGGRYDALIPAMGGGNVPASGFALYLERLMNLLNPEAASGTAVLRIRVQGADMPQVFCVAESLRQAGYIAEIDLDVQKTADTDWTVNVSNDTILVSDRSSRRKAEVRTIDELLAFIGRRK